MGKIRIYRGFANAPEAINVLREQTAGGVILSDDEWESLYRDNYEQTITQQMNGTDGREGIFQVNSAPPLDRKGVIEYTTNMGTALYFGTLCVMAPSEAVWSFLFFTWSFFKRRIHPLRRKQTD